MENKYKVKEQVWANKGSRFVNYIIDIIVFYVLLVILFFIAGLLIGITNNTHVLTYLNEGYEFVITILFWLLYVLYYTLLEANFQVSVGKLITKTIVVNKYGDKPTTKAIIARSFSRLIPFEVFSFLGSDAYGWHDSISKTYVVDKKLLEQKKLLFNELNKIGEE